MQSEQNPFTALHKKYKNFALLLFEQVSYSLYLVSYLWYIQILAVRLDYREKVFGYCCARLHSTINGALLLTNRTP